MIAREFIAEQLRALTPDAEWSAGGVDRALELAGIFERNGILNLGELRIVPASWDVIVPGGVQETEGSTFYVPETVYHQDSFAFNYHGRNIGYMGTPTRADATPGFEIQRRGYICAWSAEGHGHVGYVVRPNKAKNGIEIAPVWDSSSDAAAIRADLLQLAQFVAFVALPLAGLSTGSLVGNAIFGAEFAAAYPAVASAAGNAAIATVFNGGDIAVAAKGAALSIVGGQAGGIVGAQVQQYTSSPLFAALASTVAQTAVTGGDIKTAAFSTILSQGGKMLAIDDGGVIFDYPGFEGGGIIDDGTFDNGGVYQFDPLPPLINDYDPTTFDWGSGAGDWWQGGESGDWGEGGGGYDDSGYNPGWDSPLPTDLPPYQYPTTLPPIEPVPIPDMGSQPFPTNSSAYNPQTIIQTVTAAAMAGLQLVAAFRNLNNPVQPIARTVTANGGVAVVGNNGLIQTRSSTGSVSYSRPPVGVAQATLDGSWVVNNGNGTYTLVNSAGQSETRTYSTPSTAQASASGFQVSPVMLALGAGALLLIAKGR